MASLSVSAAEIAQRLDLPASAVRAALRSAAGNTVDTVSDAPELAEPGMQPDMSGHEWREEDAT
ncbi:hypothetical protein C5D07_14890 [Rathayibacter tritici]|nr:hypothetical protein [Rathayibacter tritici]PPF28033.1 hypothetical protein C5C06_08520 [Rathayibacter tritici]PPI10676.1 hypothetical protein C5D07_14890 [Rathayibacter tritici]